MEKLRSTVSNALTTYYRNSAIAYVRDLSTSDLIANSNAIEGKT